MGTRDSDYTVKCNVVKSGRWIEGSTKKKSPNHPLAGDASSRSYVRLSLGGGGPDSAVVMLLAGSGLALSSVWSSFPYPWRIRGTFTTSLCRVLNELAVFDEPLKEGTLVWYSRLSPEEKARADERASEIAGELFNKALDKLTESEAAQVHKRVKREFS